MTRLKKLAEPTNSNGTNPEQSIKELTFDDIIAEKGEEVVKQAVLSYYEGCCLETYIWKDIFGEAKIKDLKRMSYDEVLFLAQDDEENTWEQIKYALGYGDDIEFSDDLPNDITDFFDDKCSSDFDEAFESFLESYIKNDHTVDPHDNTHENTYNNTYNNEHNNTWDSTNGEPPPGESDDDWKDDEEEGEKTEEIEDTSELSELDDAVGDTASLSSSFSIDYPDRDAPFLFIDGEFIEGNSSDSHTQLLNRWCEENDIDQFSEKWYRLPSNKIKQQIDKDKVAFGHIDAGMAFIETCIGCSPEEVLQSIQDAGGYDKVYKWSKNGQTATRLAKVSKGMEDRQKYYLRLYKRLFKNNK